MPIAERMSVDQLVLTRGLRETRGILDEWSHHPFRTVGRWVALSALIAVVLLYSVYVVAKFTTPDLSLVYAPGIGRPATGWADASQILFRNTLVLALHAMVCVAVFIATSSLPQEAARMAGFWRWVHDKAGALALLFVSAATLFSLVTQVYALGAGTASLAGHLGTRPSILLLTLLPHALPELTAVFLPLAACLVASARQQTDQLLAATFVTVAIGLPVLLLTATIEVYLTPLLLERI